MSCLTSKALILSGYGEKNLRQALRRSSKIVEVKAARRWLGRLLKSLQFATFRGSRRHAPPYLGDLCSNVAFNTVTTAFPRASPRCHGAFSGFSLPFQEGMNEPSRARRLGDDGASAPEHWRWGKPGQAVHGVLAVFAGHGDAVPEDWVRIAEFISAQMCNDHGVAAIKVLDTLQSNRLLRKEHFGFRDGIANPRLGGLPRDHGDDVLPPGEFLLGQPNAYGKLPMSPEVPASSDPRRRLKPVAQRPERRDFGRNGSYLVFRQLMQDVQGFWSYVEQARQTLPNAPPGRAGRQWLAAKFVGRWPNGTPLSLFPNAPGPEVDDQADAFSYALNDDSFGDRCPIGSHIRRTNPRDTALPVPHDPESSGDPREADVRTQRIELTNRHRILRRGRAYGPPVDDDYDIDALRRESSVEERGLHFLCFNANLSRQFEFVQSNWAQNPSFAGLSSDPDPLLGADRAVPFRARDFTIQGCPVRRVRELPRVVETRGGAYFFMPSRSALEYLARE